MRPPDALALDDRSLTYEGIDRQHRSTMDVDLRLMAEFGHVSADAIFCQDATGVITAALAGERVEHFDSGTFAGIVR